MIVCVEHVRQNVLGVLESLHHLQVGRLHCTRQRISAPLSFLVDICDNLGLRGEHDLCVVLEVDLDHFIGESEHDSMSSPHPLLHIDDFNDLALLRREVLFIRLHNRCTFWQLIVIHSLALLIAFEVASEMLEESDFLLELLWILSQVVLLANILAVATPTLHVVEVESIWIQNNLG